jgi:hypothetical protein
MVEMVLRLQLLAHRLLGQVVAVAELSKVVLRVLGGRAVEVLERETQLHLVTQGLLILVLVVEQVDMTQGHHRQAIMVEMAVQAWSSSRFLIPVLLHSQAV